MSRPVSGLQHVQCPPAGDTLSMAVCSERGCLAFPTARGGGGQGGGERALVTWAKTRLQCRLCYSLKLNTCLLPSDQPQLSQLKQWERIGLGGQGPRGRGRRSAHAGLDVGCYPLTSPLAAAVFVLGFMLTVNTRMSGCLLTAAAFHRVAGPDATTGSASLLPPRRWPRAGKAHVSPWERGWGSDPVLATDQPGGSG